MSPLPVITIDKREQTPLAPWVYVKGAPWPLATERGTLTTGDYALRDLPLAATIERKSLGDLVGTLYGSRSDSVGARAGSLERFRAELDRARAIPFRRILIESSLRELFEHRYHSSKPPQDVLALLTSLELDYSIPVVWAGGPRGAGALVGLWLTRIWSQATEETAARKAEGRGVTAPWLRAGRA